MKRRLVLLSAAVLLIGLVVPLPAQDTVKEFEYYPLKVGTTWEYLASGGLRITLRVTKVEKYNDVPCALVEASVKGKVLGGEHIAVGKDGVYRHSMQGDKLEPALRFLKVPFKSGDSWKIEAKIAGQDVKTEYTYSEAEITVPAGKFKTIVTKTNKFTVGGKEIEATIWYAKGVGMVKQIVSSGGNKFELELDKFTPAK
jgi:hypothetical protein